MSEVGRIAERAMRRELATVEDNLYRYKHFADPDGTTGNGEPIRDVIAQLERERDELIEALR
jgi:hypothetical protein